MRPGAASIIATFGKFPTYLALKLEIPARRTEPVAEESAVTCFWTRRVKSLRSWSGTELKKRPILEGANYGTQEIVLGRSPTPYSDAPSGTVPDVLIGTQLDPASLVEAAIGTSDLVAFGQRPESPSEATSKAGRPGAPGAGVAIQLELNQAK